MLVPRIACAARALSCGWTPVGSISVSRTALAGFHSSATLEKNRRSAVPKVDTFRKRRMTYEQATYPEYIGVRKSWNSFNTSNLKGGSREAETTWEDMFIRRLIKGTWHGLIMSEVIVKRRHNIIYVAALVLRSVSPRSMYFLVGYSEELLSHFLRCPVKLELQSIQHPNDVVFKQL